MSQPTNHRIIHGDCRQMQEVDDHEIRLIITSPPYWQLKDYGEGRQIGFHDTYETYINHLNLVWQECHRVLHPGCRLCVNIGDQFARAAYYGRYKVIPIRTEIIRMCETLGFDYMGAIIWQKVTTTNTSGGASIMGSFPRPRNGILKIDYEFILLFKKPGKEPKVDKATKQAAAMTTEEWNTYFAGHWQFPGARQDAHLAAFPEELPHRLIRMFSFPGETILDPFLGSGTTALAAQKLGRHSVGYEINDEYLPIIRERLGDANDLLFQKEGVDVIEQTAELDLHTQLDALPYRFEDPIQFDKKVDPRKRQYGSRVDGKDQDNDQTYLVDDILAPDRVSLKNGPTVRLIGILPIDDKHQDAIDFLRRRTSGTRVYLKHDKRRAKDDDDLPLVYLHLKNRTHLNAHLIKQGLAAVDTSWTYRHRKRFESYAK